MHLLVTLIEQVLAVFTRVGDCFVALDLLKDLLVEEGLLGWATLVAKVTLHHLFFKLAPLANLFTSAGLMLGVKTGA